MLNPTITLHHADLGDEVDLHCFAVCASDVRIAPGGFPKAIGTSVGNGRPFVLRRVDEYGTAHYLQGNGCVRLKIWND